MVPSNFFCLNPTTVKVVLLLGLWLLLGCDKNDINGLTSTSVTDIFAARTLDAWNKICTDGLKNIYPWPH